MVEVKHTPDTSVQLTEWERSRLSQYAASNALTYMGHHVRGGLRPSEVNEMERWEALSDKLSAKASQTSSASPPTREEGGRDDE